jgi:hypothetical protein
MMGATQAAIGGGFEPVNYRSPRRGVHPWLLRVVREGLILVGLAVAAGMVGVLELPKGWLAVPLARAVLLALTWAWDLGRWRALGAVTAAAGALTLLALIFASAAPQPSTKSAGKGRKAVPVESAQVDQVKKATDTLGKLATVAGARLGQLLPDEPAPEPEPKPKPKPKPKDGGR